VRSRLCCFCCRQQPLDRCLQDRFPVKGAVLEDVEDEAQLIELRSSEEQPEVIPGPKSASGKSAVGSCRIAAFSERHSESYIRRSQVATPRGSKRTQCTLLLGHDDARKL
jgi:type IV pilus biogenesis protein CpaD/CtpE